MSDTARQLPVRDGLVLVGELAEYLQTDRANLFRKLKKLGIRTERRSATHYGNQWVAVIPEEDARRYLSTRKTGTLRGETITYLEGV